jgi:hypothetical protein
VSHALPVLAVSSRGTALPCGYGPGERPVRVPCTLTTPPGTSASVGESLDPGSAVLGQRLAVFSPSPVVPPSGAPEVLPGTRPGTCSLGRRLTTGLSHPLAAGSVPGGACDTTRRGTAVGRWLRRRPLPAALRIAGQVQGVATRAVARAVRRGDRGDVPGWVLVTLMTAGLVLALWGVARDRLADVFNNAIDGVLGGAR